MADAPGPSDYLRILGDQNPWHSRGRVPEELAPPVRRPLVDLLWPRLIRPPLERYYLILGPRRVGKTTVMYQTVQRLLDQRIDPRRLWWLRLDHPLLVEQPLGAVVQQLLQHVGATVRDPLYLFLDELTYSPRWDLWLKTFYDERWPLRLVGTSSAAAAIRQRGTESGVGRWEEQYLTPYRFTEYLSLVGALPPLPSEPSLAGTLDALRAADCLPAGLAEHRRALAITGGFPELLLDRGGPQDDASRLLRSQRVLRSDAVEKAIYKDIPQAFQILEPAKLERLLYALAGQMTGLLSPAALAADLSLTVPTIDKYIHYLERAFMVFTLPGYAAAEETVQRRGRKLYFMDGAVRNAALLRGLALLDDPRELGLLAENMVAAHLASLAQHAGVRLYHWRQKGLEVDLVFDHPERPLAFEVTQAARHSPRGLLEFQRRFPRFEGGCYLVSARTEFAAPAGHTPGHVPLDSLLIAVGLQTQQALEAHLGP